MSDVTTGYYIEFILKEFLRAPLFHEGVYFMGRGSERNNNGTSFFKQFTQFWGALFTLVSVAFIAALVYLDVLPLKYMVGVFAIVAVLWALIFPVLYIIKFKKSRKIIAVFLSTLMIFFYGVGVYYLTGTISFLSGITTGDYTIKTFEVFARSDDARYKKLKDIADTTVYSVSGEYAGEAEAKEEVERKYLADVDYYDSISDLGTDLLNSNCDLIMLGENHKNEMIDISPDFDKATKVVGKIKVKVKIKDIAKRKNLSKESYNIYISGIDNGGNINDIGRSDVNMIVTVNPVKKKILLTSIPRDYRIYMKKFSGASDKLTHTGIYGIDTTVEAVEDLLNVDINYYYKVNFETVKRLIDSIDGIDVPSDRDLNLEIENGVYYKYNKGMNHLMGREALAFARERDSYEEGDLHRNENQQAVMKAIIEKGTSSKTILMNYGSILRELEDYMSTNMNEDEIKTIIKNELKHIGGWDIETQNLTGEGNSDILYSTPGDYAYVMEQDQEVIDMARAEILKTMKN